MYESLADDSMRSSFFEANTGALIANKATTAAISAATYFAFMLHSPFC